MEAKLVVIGGKANMGEVKLRLPMTIGRGNRADLMISHPTVSREHCKLLEQGGELVVKDNGSSNGTFVNGSKISKPTVVKPGEILAIGPLTFRAEYEAPTARMKTPAPGELADTAAIDRDELDLDFLLDDEPAKPAPAKSKAAPPAVEAKAPAGPAKKPAKAPAEQEKKPTKPAAAAPAPPMKETAEIDIDFLLDDDAPKSATPTVGGDEIDFGELDFGEPAAPAPEAKKSAAEKEPSAKEAKRQPEAPAAKEPEAKQTTKPKIGPPASEEAFEQTVDFGSVAEADEAPAAPKEAADLDFDFLSDLGGGEEKPAAESPTFDFTPAAEADATQATPPAVEPAATAASDDVIDLGDFLSDLATATPAEADAPSIAPAAEEAVSFEAFAAQEIVAESAVEPATSEEPSAAAATKTDAEPSFDLDEFLADVGPTQEPVAEAPSFMDVAVSEAAASAEATPASPLSEESPTEEPPTAADAIDFSSLTETQEVALSPAPAEELTIDVKAPATEPAFDFLEKKEPEAAPPAAEAAATESPEADFSLFEEAVQEPVAEQPVAEAPAASDADAFDFLADLDTAPTADVDAEPKAELDTAPQAEWEPAPQSEAVAESPAFDFAPPAAEPVAETASESTDAAAEELSFDFLAEEPAAMSPTAETIEPEAAQAEAAEPASADEPDFDFGFDEPATVAEAPAAREDVTVDFRIEEEAAPAASAEPKWDDLVADLEPLAATEEQAAEAASLSPPPTDGGAKSAADEFDFLSELPTETAEAPTPAGEPAAAAAAEGFDWLAAEEPAPAEASAAGDAASDLPALAPLDETTIAAPSQASLEEADFDFLSEPQPEASRAEPPAEDAWPSAPAAEETQPASTAERSAEFEPEFDFTPAADAEPVEAAGGPEVEATTAFTAFEPAAETPAAPAAAPPIVGDLALPALAPGKHSPKQAKGSVFDKIKLLFGGSKGAAKKGAKSKGKDVAPPAKTSFGPLAPEAITAKAVDTPIPLDDAPIPLEEVAASEPKFEFSDEPIGLDTSHVAENITPADVAFEGEPAAAEMPAAETVGVEAFGAESLSAEALNAEEFGVAEEKPVAEEGFADFAGAGEAAEAQIVEPLPAEAAPEIAADAAREADTAGDDFFAAVDLEMEADRPAETTAAAESLSDEAFVGVPAPKDAGATIEPAGDAFLSEVAEPGEAAPPEAVAEAAAPVAPTSRRPRSVDVDVRLTSSLRGFTPLALRRPHIAVPHMEPEEPHGRSFAPPPKPARPEPEAPPAVAASAEPLADATDAVAPPADEFAFSPVQAPTGEANFDDFLTDAATTTEESTLEPTAESAGEIGGTVDDAFDFLAESSEESAAREAQIEAAQDAAADALAEDEFFMVLDEPTDAESAPTDAAAESPAVAGSAHDEDLTAMFVGDAAATEEKGSEEIDLGFLDLEIADEAAAPAPEQPVAESEAKSPSSPIAATNAKKSPPQDEELDDFLRDLGIN